MPPIRNKNGNRVQVEDKLEIPDAVLIEHGLLREDVFECDVLGVDEQAGIITL